MTKEQLAGLLTGREYPFELTRDEDLEAKRSGLVVCYGASDDLCEFEGAIRDEVGCNDGGTIYLTRKGPLQPHEERCQCEFCGYKAAKEKAAQIEAMWDQDGYSWTYETTIPHATFEIVEDGEKYCRGIVFELVALPES